MKTLEERMDQALLRGKISQAKIAYSLGISRQSITAIKQGKIKPDEYLGRMSAMLGVDPDWLMSGLPDRAPPWAPQAQSRSVMHLEHLTSAVSELAGQVTALTGHQRDVEALLNESVSMRLQRSIRNSDRTISLIAQAIGMKLQELSGPIYEPIKHPDAVRKIASALGEDVDWILTGKNPPDWYTDGLIPLEEFS